MSKKKAATTTTAKADLRVIMRNVEDLKPDPNNARTHSKAQIEKIRGSLREFGFTNPILLRPDDVVGAGNGRLEAAKLEGFKRVPTITLRLTPIQWRAYALADNRIALDAGWNPDVLRAELAAIDAKQFNLDAVGFTGRELVRFGVRDGTEPTLQLGEARFEVIVTCASEKEQERLIARLTKEGFTCRALIG